MARIKLQRVKHAGDILRAGEEFLRILLADVDRNKWEGGLLMDTRTRDKEEPDRSGNKKTRLEQDVQRDLWTRRLSRRAQEKKEKDRAGDGGKIRGNRGEIHGSVYGGSVRDGQFMG